MGSCKNFKSIFNHKNIACDYGILISNYPQKDARNEIDFCGLKFNSPLVLLSGCVGFGEEYTRINGFSNKDVGAICLKGTTLEPRLGNSPHRISETYLGMLNAIGLQNPGSQVVVDEYLPNLFKIISFTKYFDIKKQLKALNKCKMMLKMLSLTQKQTAHLVRLVK